MIQILIADDHALFREGLKQIFARYPEITVAGEAADGKSVIELVRERSFDVVVLDISMPIQSGWDALAAIKKERADQPVLILSMHPEDQYAIRMLKAGAAGYVTKESAPEDLVAAIHKVASGGRYVSPFLAEKLAFALEGNSDKLPHQLLSNREFQVMHMLASGKSLKEIADALSLSEKTITTYRARVLAKMNLRNNVELTHYAIENKLLE